MMIENEIFTLPLFSFLPVRIIIQKVEFFILRSAGNNIFDESYYLERNPDVAASNLEALEHFIKYGHKEGRNPCALFDTFYYRQQAGISDHFPLSEMSHFLLYGCERDISPTPWFDYQYYRRENRDVSQSKIDPYIHFLRFGCHENRCGSPKFDPETYLENHPDLRLSRIPAIFHYLDSLKFHANQLSSIASRLYQRRHGLNSEDLVEDIEQALDRLPEPETSAAGKPVLDVIIPVYRGYDITLRCLYSVLASSKSNKTPFQLIVINDSSPEPELSEMLEKLAGRGYFHLIAHKANFGFVKTVNEGMRLHPDKDVILLNSDTEVFSNWLDRLRAAAYRLANASSVTPLTNNGTICSYPNFAKDNPHPLEISYEQLDEFAAKKNAGKAIPAPTAVGFCMYIRRDALDNVGYFDEAAFGRGYGEENDFCQRAQAAGWVDLIAADVFVRHLGGASFQDESGKRIRNALKIIDKRYPHYQDDVKRFVKVDPLRKMRATLDIERLKALRKDKNTLIISHQRGGGTEQHIHEETERLERDGYSLFRLLAEKGHDDVVHMTHMNAPDVPNLAGLKLPKEQDRLIQLLKDLEIGEVLVHHLFDFSIRGPRLIHELLKKAGIPYSFVAHDYLAICPRTNLADENGVYCGEPEESVCRSCLAKNGSDFAVRDILAWRDGYVDFINGAERIVAPCDDAKLRLKRYFPQANIITVPHEKIGAAPLKKRRRRSEMPVRIGVVGAIGLIKGFDVLLRCAEFVRKNGLPVEFVVVGYTKNDMLARRSGIHITGSYRNGHVLELIKENDLDIIFFPALWPETFSYTLSIALKTGLPIAAFDIGAIAERLKGLPHALLMPLEQHKKPHYLIEQLLSLAGKPSFPAGNRTLTDMLAENIVQPEKFEADMKRLAPSQKDYIIFFTPRSGSSYLTALLASTKCAGNPEEYFNLEWVSKIARRFNAANPDQYIEILKRRRKTANGVFGAELSYFHYERLAGSVDFFSHFPKKVPFIFLFREDLVLQGISLYKAVESDLFHSINSTPEQRRDAEESLQYDNGKIKYWIDHVHRQENGFFRLLSENKLNAALLSYELMFSLETDELLKGIFRHLDIEFSVKNGEISPLHQKIGTSLNEEYKDRFVQENRKYIKTLDKKRKPLLKMLHQKGLYP